MSAFTHKPRFIWLLLTALVCQFVPAAVPLSSGWRSGRVSAFDACASTPRTVDQALRTKVAEACRKLPLRFEASAGRTHPGAAFSARGKGYNIFVAPTEAVIELPMAAASPSGAVRSILPLRMKLAGANPTARVAGSDELPGKSNYFVGADSSQWRTRIPTYARVQVANVYRGVDMVYYGQGQGLEYDFNLAPGADYKAIGLRFDGARRIAVDATGDLLIDTAAGEVRQHQPVAYQFINGVRREVAARYVLKARGEVGFSLCDYDRRLPLVIDPVLAYSTFFGGNDDDFIRSIALDSQGFVYVTGTTSSSDFPVRPGGLSLPDDLQSISSIGFISKLDLTNNTVVQSTYIGGSKTSTPGAAINECMAIAVDSSGNAYVTGKTNAVNFPTTAGAFQTALAGGSSDAFVAKLNATGTALVYSTYLGSSKSSDVIQVFTSVALDEGVSIAVDASGSAYVTGRTTGNNFPTTPGALKATHSNDVFALPGVIDSPIQAFADAFTTKLNPAGTGLLYSTYLGGRGEDSGSGIAIDKAGNAYVIGTTEARDFPTSNALQATLNSNRDAFVSKLNADGSALIYSTYLGGSGDDAGMAIALDESGNAYVTGTTSSTDLPTTASAFQRASADVNLFKSTNGGASWAASNVGIPTITSVSHIAIDPANSSVVYALDGALVCTSTDSGQRWQSNLNLPDANFNFQPLRVLAFDPKKPSTIYGEGGQFLRPTLLKSLDGGRTWEMVNSNFPSTAPLQGIFLVAVDPVNTATFYVHTSQGLFKTTDGLNWVERDKGLFDEANSMVFLAIDPKNSSRLFASVGGTLFRSVNGGKKWERTSLGDAFVFDLAFDPVTPATVYASGAGLLKSSDGGDSWQEIDTDLPDIGSLVIDPANSSVLYTVTFAGTFKSSDGGHHWVAINNGLSREPGSPTSLITFLAIDPRNPATLYAGSDGGRREGFVAKLIPSGTGFAYFTYLGGRGDDAPSAIAVDVTGNAYVTGQASPIDFPLKKALQPAPLRSFEIFITKLNADGASLAYSTYLGGSSIDVASAIALDGFGNAYIAGRTFSADYPLVDPLLPLSQEFDGFITKIADADPPLPPPTIGSVTPSAGAATGQFTVSISGTGFRPGARVYFDGSPVPVIDLSPDHITVRVNAHIAGVVSVVVSNPGAQGAVLKNGFAFLPVPEVGHVEIEGKVLEVVGNDFDKGAVILVNGVAQKTQQAIFSAQGQTFLTSKKAGKKIPRGQPVTVQVRNANGLTSAPFTYIRPAS